MKFIHVAVHFLFWQFVVVFAINCYFTNISYLENKKKTSRKLNIIGVSFGRWHGSGSLGNERSMSRKLFKFCLFPVI
jgi:hypothetical protein